MNDNKNIKIEIKPERYTVLQKYIMSYVVKASKRLSEDLNEEANKLWTENSLFERMLENNYFCFKEMNQANIVLDKSVFGLCDIYGDKRIMLLTVFIVCELWLYLLFPRVCVCVCVCMCVSDTVFCVKSKLCFEKRLAQAMMLFRGDMEGYSNLYCLTNWFKVKELHPFKRQIIDLLSAGYVFAFFVFLLFFNFFFVS